VENLAVLCAKNKLKSVQISFLDILEIHTFETLWLCIGTISRLVLGACRNGEDPCVAPLVVEDFMLCHKEAMDSFLVQEHLLNVFPLQHVIIYFGWSVILILQIKFSDHLVPSG
jgi:hypothetical protein